MKRDGPAELRLILGDQLGKANPVLGAPFSQDDRLLMIEAPGESTHVPSHKARTTLFLSAMRHRARELREDGLPLHYVHLNDHPAAGLRDRLEVVLEQFRPGALVVAEPGDWRVLQDLRAACAVRAVELRVLPDQRFLCSTVDFQRWAGGRASLRMETFYRHMRQSTGALMAAGEPEGGRWNHDSDNRRAFGRQGPGLVPPPVAFPPDTLTREVMTEVERSFPANPGRLERFDWPVTRAQALLALDDFVTHRLAAFGPFQDAMWSGQPWLWHARLSPCLNLGLLDPGEVIEAVLAARTGLPPASVEGFLRQVLGWREFIRGVYWLTMPGLASANHYGHEAPLPAWYWTAGTHMNCMRETVGQTLELGYAHHIQRLMVTGNFALLAQVRPQAVAAWYLAMYVDAVEWAELPNTAGMALHADGGRFTSKPYAASGAYIRRMSNYCSGCRYDPAARSGARACPVTLLYWAFVDRHEAALRRNPRTAPVVSHVARLTHDERALLRRDADRLLASIDTV